MLRLSLICLCLCITQIIAFQCPQKDGLFRDPTNPNKYYDCDNGEAFPFFCPADLVFDESNRRCDIAANVKTGSPETRTSPSVHSSTQTIASTARTDATKLSTHETQVSTHSTHGPDVSTQKSTDCDGKSRFFKDSTNPHKFHECVDGKVVDFSCPEKLVFNEAKNVCDFDNKPATGTVGHTVEVSTHAQTSHTNVRTESSPHITPTPGPTEHPQTEGTRVRHTHSY